MEESIITIKGHTLIANAGIDESNANGYYILWPKRPSALAKEIRAYLKKKYKIKNLAVVVTDSHIIPLRHGTTGISIGFYGMEPLYDYRGMPDILAGYCSTLPKTSWMDYHPWQYCSWAKAANGRRSFFCVVRNSSFLPITIRIASRSWTQKNDLYSPLWKEFT